MRMYHSLAKPGVTATEGEKSVLVYDSPEFQSFSQASSGGNVASFDSAIIGSPYKSKFFSLIPFQIESKFTAKSFVLRMELFPESSYLKMHTLKLNGV